MAECRVDVVRTTLCRRGGFLRMGANPKEETMNQPELGMKVAELRQQKGLTQEQLAERCEVSSRTIQRIECGEVDPRAYTLHCLGEALEFDFGEAEAGNEAFWLTVLHLSSILPVLVVPLLLWSWKKNQSGKLDQQGRQVLNFQVTMFLLLTACGFLLIVFPAALILLGQPAVDSLEHSPLFILGIICLPAPGVLVGIFCVYQGVVNAVRALTDRPIRYALSIPFVK
jgi:transcriptional regulator with XRE-family HTH domain